MSISNTVSIAVVRLIHVSIVAYILVTPYVSIFPGQNNAILNILIDALYLVSCTSIILHWKMNDDTCVLTIIEAWLRGKEIHEGFIYSIISPVYKFPENKVRLATRTVMLANMLVVAIRLCKKVSIAYAAIKVV